MCFYFYFFLFNFAIPCSGQHLTLKLSIVKVISSQTINPQHWRIIQFSTYATSRSMLNSGYSWLHTAAYWIQSLVSLKVRPFMLDLVIDPSTIKRMFLIFCILVKLRLPNTSWMLTFILPQELSPWCNRRGTEKYQSHYFYSSYSTLCSNLFNAAIHQLLIKSKNLWI